MYKQAIMRNHAKHYQNIKQVEQVSIACIHTQVSIACIHT